MIFDHYRYVDAFMDYVKIHPLNASCDTLKAIAQDNGIHFDMEDDHQGWLDLLFSHLVEPNLGKDLPTVIFDYPVSTASLAKTAKDQDGNTVAKRFELYINGLEIANAYDELADGQALRLRFDNDNLERKKRGLPMMPIDEHLLNACDNLPPCSGIAVGLDRLIMAITGATKIENVIAFPIDKAWLMDKAIKAQFDKQLSQVLANLAIYEKSKAFKKIFKPNYPKQRLIDLPLG